VSIINIKVIPSVVFKETVKEPEFSGLKVKCTILVLVTKQKKRKNINKNIVFFSSIEVVQVKQQNKFKFERIEGKKLFETLNTIVLNLE